MAPMNRQMQITVISIHDSGKASAEFTRLGKHLAVVQRIGESSNQSNAQDETEVAHAVHHKSLHLAKMAVGLLNQKPISK